MWDMDGYSELASMRSESVQGRMACFVDFFFLMIRRPPRSTQSRSSAASDVYKRQLIP